MRSPTPAADLALLLFDVDGIFTDNGLYVDEDGRMSKRFDIRDGAAVKLAQMAGYQVGLISGHDSRAVEKRAEQLGIAICHVGVKDKAPVFEAVLRETGCRAEEALYMGDDLFDLPVLTRAGFAATVPEAPDFVRRRCHWTASRPGGRGAVRELVEHLLRETGRLDEIQTRFLPGP